MSKVNSLLLVIITLGLLLVACQTSAQAPISTETPTHTETPSFTATPIYTDTPTPTRTVMITPKITATPIIKDINTDADLKNVIYQIYPFPCFSYNYAKEPLSEVNHASTLTFIEVDIQVDSKKYWVPEVANNADGSRQAFVACEPDFCQEKIYVKDEKSQKTYEIDWDARMPWRPIQWITWINNDILVFHQSSNPEQATILAVDFEKREVLYQAVIFPDYACTTPTATP